MQTALLISVIVLVLLMAIAIIGGIFLAWIFYQLSKGLVEKLVALDEATNLVVEKLETIGESLQSIQEKAETLEVACSNLVTPLEDLKGYNQGVVGGAKLLGTGLENMTRLLAAWMKILHSATGSSGNHFQAGGEAAESLSMERMSKLNSVLAEFQDNMNQGKVRIAGE